MKKTAKALFLALIVIFLFSACGTEYKRINLELINRSGKDVVGVYFYPDESIHKYVNFVGVYPGTEDGVWKVGKGGTYLTGFVLRPYSDAYTLEINYKDGSNLFIKGLEFVPDVTGHIPNSIIINDSEDPSLSVFEYDDGQPIPITVFREAKAPMDTFTGNYPYWLEDN